MYNWNGRKFAGLVNEIWPVTEYSESQKPLQTLQTLQTLDRNGEMLRYRLITNNERKILSIERIEHFRDPYILHTSH